uniref:Uncharacterized protein n=1 Tax=Graphocephala atropunctata TaxID=36148 RepID=A0A1B6MBI8_9HEMI
MALLEDCFFCSLSVAASVIGVYTLVAYLIAFSMETWWIVSTPVSLPSPAYVLCAGYLIVFVFSVLLLRGLSIKNSLYLLEWLVVVAALSVPEGVLVYFMSIHYWKIRSLYGLMELTCWICRAIVNVSGIICVQSLYSNWREEKEVIRRLRDLNMTRVIPNRRNSVSSQGNGYSKSSLGTPTAYTPPPQLLNNGAFVPTLRRTASMVSVLSRPPNPAMLMGPPPPIPLHPFLAANPAVRASEFNASQFDLSLISSLRTFSGQQVNKSYSMMDLRSVDSAVGSAGSDTPRKTMSVIDFPVEKKTPTHTQSLDRRILKLPAYGRPIPPQIEGFYVAGRLENAYFPPFRSGDFSVDPVVEYMQGRESLYRQNMNVFYPNKPHSRSKYSLGSDSDDFQKYRDIAL